MSKKGEGELNRLTIPAETQPQGIEQGVTQRAKLGVNHRVKHGVKATASVRAFPRKRASRLILTAAAPSPNPCLSCADTPCCKRLPLERIEVRSRADLETLRKYLLHRWFEVGLKDDGTWMLFYQRPCRNLDPRSGLCAVHGTLQKPWTCKEYPSHHCWYQRVFRTEQCLEFIRFDARRIAILLEMVSYDADTGEIADVPSWEEMIRIFASCPLDDPSTRAPGGARKEFRFPVPPPQKERHLALFEFRQNFPGVRILRGKRAWVTVVETYEA